MRRIALAASVLTLAAGVAGCGGGHQAVTPSTSATTTVAPPNGPGALQAEATAAATGDIPDNQVFLVFTNVRVGYSMKYPEGWAQQGSGNAVSFRDKNNIVRIDVRAGGAPTNASVQRDLARLHGARVVSAAQAVSLAGRPAFKVVYSTESAANAVTGKRVKLIVDRYYLWTAGRRAVVDLGTPQGVDNVDAYRLMIESFRWK